MRRFALLAAAACAAVSLWAQPKVAVLDAVVPNNIDQSVVIPVTEKVIERLVVSGRYTVLDRANVDKVLREREFQLSGLVSDAEITEAGKYLGADFVVVAKVQRVADTYFISGKMIAVKTGIIANQSSAESEGKLSVLIKLAERVGDVLSGSPVLADAAPAKLPPAEAKSAAAEPVRAPARQKPVRDERVGLRLYGGFGGGTQDLTDTYDDYGPFDASGVDLYVLYGFPFLSSLCAVANISYFSGADSYAYSSYYGLSVDGAEVTSFDFGLGYVKPIGNLLVWAALKAGTTVMTWGVDSEGAEFAADVGIDLRIRDILVGGRYQFQSGTLSASGYADVDMSQNSFWFMLGYRF